MAVVFPQLWRYYCSNNNSLLRGEEKNSSAGSHRPYSIVYRNTLKRSVFETWKNYE